jgi:hypothetical protein
MTQGMAAGEGMAVRFARDLGPFRSAASPLP